MFLWYKDIFTIFIVALTVHLAEEGIPNVYKEYFMAPTSTENGGNLVKYFILERTLNELENYPNTPHYESNLAKRCLELRNKKLKFFSAGDLRIMIGQKESLEYLIPMALEVLAENPFIDSELYYGDLLQQVLSVHKDFWDKNQDLYYELDEIIINVKTFIGDFLPIINKYQSPYS